MPYPIDGGGGGANAASLRREMELGKQVRVLRRLWVQLTKPLNQLKFVLQCSLCSEL